MADINILQELVGKTIKSISFDRENDSDPAGAVVIQCTDNSDYEISIELNTQIDSALTVEKITKEDLSGGSVDMIYEGEGFWDEKIEDVDKLMNLDDVKKKLSNYVKENNLDMHEDWDDISSMSYNFLEDEYNKALANYNNNAKLKPSDAIDSTADSDWFWEDKDKDVFQHMNLSYIKDEIDRYAEKSNLDPNKNADWITLQNYANTLLTDIYNSYNKKLITKFVEEHAKLSINDILESNYFWEDKDIAVKKLIYDIDGLKTEVVSYLKKQKNYNEIINSEISEQLETDTHDIVYEFLEDKYNRAYANFIETIEFSLLNNLFGGLNDEFIPDNFIDIVSFVGKDVLKSNFIKDSDKGYWNVFDIKLAFRRWMESNE